MPRHEEMTSRCAKGGSGWTLGRISPQKGLLNTGTDYPRSGVPGDVQETGHGTPYHGLLDKVVFGHGLDSVSEIFSNINDCIIPPLSLRKVFLIPNLDKPAAQLYTN